MPLIDPTSSLVPSLLDRLLDDDPMTTSPLFTLFDLLNPSGLAMKLRQCEDPVSILIRDQLTPDIQAGIDQLDGTSPVVGLLQEGIVKGLNQLIDGECLYTAERFQRVTLAEATIRLIQGEEKPTGRSLMFLNRWLLEDAYPRYLRTRRVQEAPYTLRALKGSVSRDIEALLNTRRELFDELPPDFKEVNNSLLFYGLPDFTTMSLMSHQDRKKINRMIKQTIEKFEPRLKDVNVVVLAPTGLDQALHFKIEAMLQVEPEPESVAFDAVLQVTTAKYDVESE